MTRMDEDGRRHMAGFLDRAKEQAQRGLTQGKQKIDEVLASSRPAAVASRIPMTQLRSAWPRAWPSVMSSACESPDSTSDNRTSTSPVMAR